MKEGFDLERRANCLQPVNKRVDGCEASRC